MLKTLNSRILFTVIGIVSFTLVISMLSVQWQSASIVQNIQNSNADDLLRAITSSIETEYHSIQFHRQAILTHRKSELKVVVDIAHTVLNNYLNNYQSGFYSKEQAQELAKQAIKNIRWDDGVGYFWINDTTMPIPKMIMHPTLPELDGTVLDNPAFNCALGKGENLFLAFNLVCQDKGEGYVDYLWPKPTLDGSLTEDRPKLSFVRLFKPWEWIVGSGVYIDDVEAEAHERLDAVVKELSETFPKIHIGENGYMFLFTGEKEVLIHPKLKGQDVSDLRNPVTGNVLFEEIMLAAKSPERTMEYRWEKPVGNGLQLFNKKLYANYFEPLDWYLCVAYYEDEVNAPVRDLGWRMVELSAFVLFVALALSFLLAKSLTSPLKKLASAAKSIDKKGVAGTEIPISGSRETRDLGHILSQTFITIGDKERFLQESRDHLQRAEKNLTKQLLFTQSLLTAIPAPIFYKDTTGRYIGCNRAFSDFVGVSVEKLRGKTAFDLWPRNLAEKYHGFDMELISNLKPQYLELEVLDAQGKQHDVIFNNDVYHDDMGNVSGIIGSFFDISQRLKAEKAVRESELKYRQLVENANDVIFIAQNGTMVFSNSKTSELTGYNSEELKHIPLTDLVHPDYRAMVGERYLRRIRGEKGIPDTYSIKMISKENLEYTVMLSSVRVEWNDSPAILCFARDITEQKKLEAAFFQAQKLDAIGQLAGGVAHDFNNMLGGILGAAQLLKTSDRQLDERGNQYVDLIIKAVSRAGELTEKLLAFGRKGKIMSTAVNVHSIIDDTVDILGKTIDKAITISFESQAGRHTVVGDNASIQSALMNLGINASHAMPDGGELRFATKNSCLNKEYCDASPFNIEAGDYIEIEIQDTGTGIPQDDLHKIYEPFFTTKKQNKGTGLGLSAVYGTVQAHHGAITVISEVGVGTVFHMYLPCSDKMVDLRLQGKVVVRGKGTLLLVDDEPIIRTTGKIMLEGMGYDVIVAENGREAVEMFRDRHNEVDLTIMDMIMPEMNGREAFFRMKAIDNSCRIIISSGFTKNESLDELRTLGLAGFIRKPFTDFELSRLVAKTLIQGEGSASIE